MLFTPFEQIIEALRPLYGAGEARSIARIVLEDAFGTRDLQGFRLAATDRERFDAILDRLQRGEPVQYVLGEADFFGLKFRVSPVVLIPRQETEALVEWAIELFRGAASPRILDIGTGSGCIAVTLQKKMPGTRVSAVDVDPAALALARENALRHGVQVEFVLHDILGDAPWPLAGPFDGVISNPPYIPMSELDQVPDYVRQHEPHLALFVDDVDPLLFYRVISAFALAHLRPGGTLLFEVNEFRAEAVAQMMSDSGLEAVELRRDLAGAWRMAKGRKPGGVEELRS